MSWEEVLKGNNTDPKNHTFSFVVECDVDDIDSEVADFHIEQGSDLIESIEDAIVKALDKKIGDDTFDLTVDISKIESDMEELEMEGFDTLDNRVSVSVRAVGKK